MMQRELLGLYDAVLRDDGLEIKKILDESLFLEEQIPVRTLTGLLVIAVDSKLINASNALLEFNKNSPEKISLAHLNAILCLAAKANLIDKLNITIH